MSLFQPSNVPFSGTRDTGHLARDKARGHLSPLACPEIRRNVPDESPRLETFQQVSAIWSYNPDNGCLTWKIDPGTRPMKGRVVSSRQSGGYVTVGYLGRGYKAHRLAWILHYGNWPNGEIDHRNGLRFDNRISNLRDVTHQQNQMNQKCHREMALAGERMRARTC